MTGNYGGQQGRGNVTLFNVIATPLIIIILASVLLVTNSIGLISSLAKGGDITYAEETVTAYKNGVYDTQFKNAKGKNAKNSGIAIMFFYNDDNGTWEHTVQAGSNVSTEFSSAIFAGEGSAMVDYLSTKLTEDIKTSEKLVNALSAMMDELADEAEDYDGKFIKKVTIEEISPSAVILMPIEGKNEKAQPVKSEDGTVLLSVADGEKLSAAMAKFTEVTGVPVVMTFDSSVRAFGRTIPTTDIFMVVLLLAVVALCVFNLVKKIRDYNRIKNDFGGQEPNQIKVNARSPYYDEDEDEVVVDDFEAVDESADEESEDEEDEVSPEEKEEAEEEEEEESNASAEEEDKKKKSLNTESDEEELGNDEDDGEDDQGLALEDEEEDEDNGIIDGGDESYDDEAEDDEIE